jgi:hypothetical protein
VRVKRGTGRSLAFEDGFLVDKLGRRDVPAATGTRCARPDAKYFDDRIKRAELEDLLRAKAVLPGS